MLVGIIEDDAKLNCLLTEAVKKLGHVVYFSCTSIEQFKVYAEPSQEKILVYLDIGLPGKSGLEGINAIRALYTNAKIVITTGNTDRDIILRAIAQGADGYLVKPIKLCEINEQLKIAFGGGALISPNIAAILLKRFQQERVLKSSTFNELTTREKDVVTLILKGLTFKEIAVAMAVKPNTVNDFAKKIYLKMGIHSKTELLAQFL